MLFNRVNTFQLLVVKKIVKCQSLVLRKHGMVLLTLFPLDMKMSNGRLNFKVANFKCFRYSPHQIIGTSYLHAPQHEACWLVVLGLTAP